MIKSHMHIHLAGRAVLRLTGADVLEFLQAIITNNVDTLEEGTGLYGALLTPQGKYIADFFLTPSQDGLFLDLEECQKNALIQKLTLYRLKSDVTIDDLSHDYQVWAHLGANPGPDSDAEALYQDPRLEGLGWRSIRSVGAGLEVNADQNDYDSLRLSLGVPDCPRDCEIGKSTAYEGNLDLLNGLSFTKGCYIGQEVTARMEYRGKIKKRLMPVDIEGPLPEPGTKIMSGERVVGEIKSGMGSRAMALLRLEHLEKAPFMANEDSRILPLKPDWMILD